MKVDQERVQKRVQNGVRRGGSRGVGRVYPGYPALPVYTPALPCSTTPRVHPAYRCTHGAGCYGYTAASCWEEDVLGSEASLGLGGASQRGNSAQGCDTSSGGITREDGIARMKNAERLDRRRSKWLLIALRTESDGEGLIPGIPRCGRRIGA